MRKDGTPTQFEGISYANTVALQEVGIWSVQDVYDADTEELIQVDGIGEELASL